MKGSVATPHGTSSERPALKIRCVLVALSGNCNFCAKACNLRVVKNFKIELVRKLLLKECILRIPNLMKIVSLLPDVEIQIVTLIFLKCW